MNTPDNSNGSAGAEMLAEQARIAVENARVAAENARAAADNANAALASLHAAGVAGTARPETTQPTAPPDTKDAAPRKAEQTSGKTAPDKGNTVEQKNDVDQENADKKAEIDWDITRRKARRRAISAGIFTLLGLTIFIGAIFIFGSKQNLFSSTFMLKTRFKSADGLRSGALVMMNGVKIGAVKVVELRRDTATYVYSEMEIESEFKPLVRRSAVALVSQVGLIGDKIVEVSSGDPNDAEVVAGAYIRSGEPPNYFAVVDEARRVVQNAESVTASLDTLFYRFQHGEGTIGKLLTDDAMYTSLLRVSQATEQTLQTTNGQLTAIGGTLQRASGNIDQLTTEGRRLVNDIGSGKGSLGALLYDRSFYDSLEAVMGTLNRTAGEIGSAGREFATNMRGLRSNWLVGGLFGGGEEELDRESREREFEIQRREIERERNLLDERARQLEERSR